MKYPATGSGDVVGADQFRSTSWDTETPVPESATFAGLLVEDVLVIVTCPVAALAAVGLNVTLSVAVWPGFSVMGSAEEENVKLVPLTEIADIVTAAVPLEVSITDCVAVEFTFTLPNAMLLELTVSVETPTFN